MKAKKCSNFLEITLLIVLGWFLQYSQNLTAFSSLLNPTTPSESSSTMSPKIFLNYSKID